MYGKGTYTERQYQERILCIVESLKAKYGYDLAPDADFRFDRFSGLEESPGLFEAPDLTEGQEC